MPRHEINRGVQGPPQPAIIPVIRFNYGLWRMYSPECDVMLYPDGTWKTWYDYMQTVWGPEHPITIRLEHSKECSDASRLFRKCRSELSLEH